MYKLGYTVHEIAQTLNTNPVVIAKWRDKMKLRKYDYTSRVERYNTRKYEEFYQLGYDDKQIAEATGSHERYVKTWRVTREKPLQVIL
jgi:hypothetical protein